uniref:Uncharacterized protein n=1 Tax=Oryza glumipatula TaxID=40148 RepID=A0A0D9Y7Z6_9ORYZ
MPPSTTWAGPPHPIGTDDHRRAVHGVKLGLTLALVSMFYHTRPLYDGASGAAMWVVMTVVIVFEYTGRRGSGLEEVEASGHGGSGGGQRHGRRKRVFIMAEVVERRSAVPSRSASQNPRGFGGGGGTNKAVVTRTGDGEARRRRDVGMEYQAAATVGRREREARAPRTVAGTTGGHKGEVRRGQRDAGEAHARPTIVGTARGTALLEASRCRGGGRVRYRHFDSDQVDHNILPLGASAEEEGVDRIRRRRFINLQNVSAYKKQNIHATPLCKEQRGGTLKASTPSRRHGSWGLVEIKRDHELKPPKKVSTVIIRK